MISVIILTKNSGKTLHQTLLSTLPFDEVVILDSGSTDNTKEIALSFSHVKWHIHDFLGFGPMRKFAEKLASHDWILALDSDEVLSSRLSQKLLTLPLKTNCAYSIPRHNFFNDKWIKWCGWHPDRQIRLYHKKTTSFSSSLVHEGVITDHLSIVALKEPLYHYSYEKIDDFLTKMQLYSSLFAKENAGKKGSSLLIAMLHGSYAFLKSYLFQKGFLGGPEGLIISLYNGHTCFYKYLKLWEANRRLLKEKPSQG